MLFPLSGAKSLDAITAKCQVLLSHAVAIEVIAVTTMMRIGCLPEELHGLFHCLVFQKLYGTDT